MQYSKLITSNNLSLMLSKSRSSCGKSQKYMAKSLGKSLGTIQNWENGYSIPNVLDLMEWFDVLGLNPLRFMLDFLHPDKFESVDGETADDLVESALEYYLQEVAPSSDKRKLAFCIFGNSGSSWSAQLDMLTAHNHTSIRSRVSAGQTIYDSYMIEKARNELIFTNNVMPDEDNFKSALTKCKVAAYDGKDGYC